jgi:hypothetical protein
MGEDERLRTAETFLVEAVFRSRAKQAALGATGGAAADGGRCGLGVRAAVELNLDRRGLDLFERLWPDGLSDVALQRVRAEMTTWIRRQDALDRERNHFMKAFRAEHGADRTAYTEEQQRAWREGLDAVNDKENAERREAARRLLAV